MCRRWEFSSLLENSISLFTSSQSVNAYHFFVGLVDSPVTIKNIEYAIVDRAWEEGWITTRIPRYRTGMNVAVVGSGPAGLATADCLNQVKSLLHISLFIVDHLDGRIYSTDTR